MEIGFRDWLCCPSCDADTEPSVLAYGTSIVLECYDCGLITEFEIGADVPFHDLDQEELASEDD